MIQTVKYSAATDIVQYPSTILVNAETDVIVVTDIESGGNGYVPSNTQCTLFVDFTKGSLTNCSLKIYGSYKGNAVAATATDWFQEVVESDTTGVGTLDPNSLLMTASQRIAYHFPIGAYRSIKISATSTGTVTSSALALTLGFRTN